MSLLSGILLLLVTTMSALGQTRPLNNRAALPNRPRAVVVSLYREVVARHPSDIPVDSDMKIFAPYLSKALLLKFDQARACSDDWDREKPEPHLKVKMVSQFGIFSGDGWNNRPRAFKIQKIQSAPDGSSRVYVQLTPRISRERPYSWRIAAALVREDGRYVIDDVIYVNDSTYDYPEEKPADRRLSDYLSAGCNGSRWAGYSLPSQPVNLVRSLYQRVVDRPPGGIPTGIDFKIFAPYMSKNLLHRIDDFDACAADWFRRLEDPRYPAKAPFGVYESGIFSGGDERTGPRAFQIERTQEGKDGSVRVDVRLAWWDEPVNKRADDWHDYTSANKPDIWHVAALIVTENGRSVVNDVIYLKDETRPGDVDYRLSQSLSQGCDGPRWVGYREH